VSDTPKWMVELAGKEVHDYFEFQYGECNEHGLYSGGPSHGEPYALCESAGRWAADEIWKKIVDRCQREIGPEYAEHWIAALEREEQ
jgi:hypothetical protein